MPLIEQQNGKLIVRGAMTVETVNVLLDESLPLLMAGGQSLELDLAAVTDADSSAISLMLEWLRVASSRQLDIKYSNLPKALISLADLYGVSEMIPQR